jgi:DNA modification methylase
MWNEIIDVETTFKPSARAVMHTGDCIDLLRTIPAGSMQLIVTSPPYNIGKEYENRLRLGAYIEQQKNVVSECARTLSPHGSICWQVGNFVEKGGIVPLDIALHPRKKTENENEK